MSVADGRSAPPRSARARVAAAAGRRDGRRPAERASSSSRPARPGGREGEPAERGHRGGAGRGSPRLPHRRAIGAVFVLAPRALPRPRGVVRWEREEVGARRRGPELERQVARPARAARAQARPRLPRSPRRRQMPHPLRRPQRGASRIPTRPGRLAADRSPGRGLPARRRQRSRASWREHGARAARDRRARRCSPPPTPGAAHLPRRRRTAPRAVPARPAPAEAPDRPERLPPWRFWFEPRGGPRARGTPSQVVAGRARRRGREPSRRSGGQLAGLGPGRARRGGGRLRGGQRPSRPRPDPRDPGGARPQDGPGRARARASCRRRGAQEADGDRRVLAGPCTSPSGAARGSQRASSAVGGGEQQERRGRALREVVHDEEEGAQGLGQHPRHPEVAAPRLRVSPRPRSSRPPRLRVKTPLSCAFTSGDGSGRPEQCAPRSGAAKSMGTREQRGRRRRRPIASVFRVMVAYERSFVDRPQHPLLY